MIGDRYYLTISDADTHAYTIMRGEGVFTERQGSERLFPLFDMSNPMYSFQSILVVLMFQCTLQKHVFHETLSHVFVRRRVLWSLEE